VQIPSFDGRGTALFGPLVFVALLFGPLRFRCWCQATGLDVKPMLTLVLPVGLAALIFSHFAAVIMYHPDNLTWKSLLNVSGGFSSMGGFLFGTVCFIMILRLKKLPLLAYVDALLYGLVAGWLFGRLGCFSVHDHVGWAMGGPFSVYIRGGLHLDLGLLELLYTMAMYVYLT
jgi:phosphatidylglycerol:prolipoprotein diacylglycerol transferase